MLNIVLVSESWCEYNYTSTSVLAVQWSYSCPMYHSGHRRWREGVVCYLMLLTATKQTAVLHCLGFLITTDYTSDCFSQSEYFQKN